MQSIAIKLGRNIGKHSKVVCCEFHFFLLFLTPSVPKIPEFSQRILYPRRVGRFAEGLYAVAPRARRTRWKWVKGILLPAGQIMLNALYFERRTRCALLCEWMVDDHRATDCAPLNMPLRTSMHAQTTRTIRRPVPPSPLFAVFPSSSGALFSPAPLCRFVLTCSIVNRK